MSLSAGTWRGFAFGMLLAGTTACSAPDAQAPSATQPETDAPPKETAFVAETNTIHDHTNRLIDSTSPYLLQHAHNPVDWYPWGPEALNKAKEEDKPIFLSVGYSACHWCHVMERESFENEEIAEVLNEHFVSIKVDREERPDIDEIYMTAVQAMTGSGGWPMSVFLTPDLKPFYGGTYYPPEPKFGRPGFKQILQAVADAWENKRDEVVQSAEKLTAHMDAILGGSVGGASPVTDALISKAVESLDSTFDQTYGGFGQAPKFPNSPGIQLLLREYRRTGDEKLLHMATLTLDKMARGGMYDHLGGGFARYSVDDQWLVPHFEKMLYDNAQLAQVYLEAFQVTGDSFYRQVVEQTFGYILRDMRDERGGFYSAEDADSEGQEGKFYIWSYDEIVEVVGKDDAEIVAAYYSVKPGGNFPSHEEYHRRMNILHTPRSDQAVADELGLSVDRLREKIAEIDRKLLDIRAQRVRPGLDDKVLTSWNALMISALAQGHQVLDDARYRDAAVEAARFILDDMTRNGHLLRTYRAGDSRIPAYLDDYACFVVALIDLYETTFDVAWLEEADRLAQIMIAEFWDDENPGFYFTSDDHKNLIVRSRTSQDSAVPSGSSMAALGLLRLAKFLDKPDYHQKAQALLEANYRYLNDIPRGFLKMLVAADYLVHPPKEVAIAGPWDAEATQDFLHAVHTHFVPNKILAWYDPESDRAEALQQTIPLLENRALVNGAPAAYVCEDFVCQRPATATEELLSQLGVKQKP